MKGMVVLFIQLFLISSSFAHSDSVTESEKVILNEMLRSLNALLTMADNAEFSRHADLRFPLNYDALREDLKIVRDGIERHMEIPGRSPRKLQDIKGDY